MALLCCEISEKAVDVFRDMFDENLGKKWDDCTEKFRHYLETLGFTKESYNNQIEIFYNEEEYKKYVKGVFKEGV